MMRPVHGTRLFLLGIALLITACSSDPLDVDISGIDLQLELERFDRDLFEMDQDTIDAAIGSLYRRYGDFFDVFNVHVISIGQASSRRYSSYLSMFINDPTNREVFEYTNQVFASTSETESVLSDGFRHYLYHYPDSAAPRVVAYVSRFNQGLFTVDRFVGIGLDQYLGSDCDYYQQMGLPRYLAQKKEPWRIPADAMLAWATQLYPFNDSVDNVLSRMIYFGQLAWFVGAMFPELEEQLIMGFTDDQMKWCRNNEKQMWTHLVEEKLLFSTDPMNIRKLVEDAPYTRFYTSESPGRAAVWQGWQIINAFAKRNPKLTVPQIMAERNYQELLRLSKYDP
ncbi:MAG: hypothetical protein P1P86_08905 [Bacteroidales bacterium]|nr:hypothetical protein [Bacteroidales bacterium]